MLPVLDNESMREADRHTIEDLGVPGLVLMENAATGVVDALREMLPEAESVLVLCGPGNNGGDGLAAARHLVNGGHQVELVLLADPQRLSQDAAANYRMALAFGIPLTVIPDDDLGPLEKLLELRQPDVIIDAILGTGLDRPLAGRLASVVELVNAHPAPVLAVDVPTGLSGACAAELGPCLDAELTVTFAALKHCHVLQPACLHCGDVAIVDIGIPPAALDQGCHLRWIEPEDAALMLPQRRPEDHKGRFGHLMIAAGSTGRGGAVAMAARAAVVIGSGLVTMVVPEPLVSVVDGACLEAMTQPLQADAGGGFDVSSPAEALGELLERMTAVATGPGMGTGQGAARLLEWLIDHVEAPLLLDADAVNLIAERPERLAARRFPTILTPHPGELARLLGCSTAEVVSKRLDAAREVARRADAVVVAKGYRTIVAIPEGEAWINPTGDSHLGSGGSGDVLTGAIGGLLAQGLEPHRACLVGCWLHGRAGELGGETFPAATPASLQSELLARAWSSLLDSVEHR